MKTKLLVIMLATTFVACGGGAQKPAGVETPENTDAIRVGSYEVYVLQESDGTGSADVLIDPPAGVLAKYAPEGTYPTATNAVLIRKTDPENPENDRIWLVDTGYGRTIFERMAALGITPGDVECVLLTHMHGDHIGGMLREGAKAFPNATMGLAQREFDHWSGEREESAMNIFAAYEGSLRMLTPVEADVLATPAAEETPVTTDGIIPVAAYGHTPGHTMFLVRDGGEQLLIWGDLTHAMAVQMPHPEISVRYDVDPVAARESRLRVLSRVASAGIPAVGMHIPATKAGRVTANGEGYGFREYSPE